MDDNFVNFYGRHPDFLRFWKALKKSFSMMYLMMVLFSF